MDQNRFGISDYRDNTQPTLPIISISVIFQLNIILKYSLATFATILMVIFTCTMQGYSLIPNNLSPLSSSSFPWNHPRHCNYVPHFIHNSHTHSNVAIHAKATVQQISQSQPNNDITTLCKEDKLKEALCVLQVMEEKGIPLDSDACLALLNACTHIKSLTDGKKIHTHMLMNGFQEDKVLGAKLVGMYALCGSMMDARLVFDQISKEGVDLWNAIIRGYANNGPLEEALNIFYQMQLAGIKPNNFTYPFLLKACAGLSALQKGKEIHGNIVRNGFESDIYVITALVDMYAKCKSLGFSRQLFDKMSERNLVSWNAMISGYAQNEYADEALALFCDMHMANVKPNSVTILSLIWACTHSSALRQGMWIHAYIIRNGIEVDDHLGSALINMYAKCGSMEIAGWFFEQLPRKGVGSWTALIAGYGQNGHFEKALAIFHQLLREGLKPNYVTMVSVLPACAHLATVEQGRWIHAYLIRSGFAADNSAENSLITMYSKCGQLQNAHRVFEKMRVRDVASWNTLIAGYGMHGHAKDALRLFTQMQQTGLKPNRTTFVSVLSACSHAGLVDEGWRYFNCMSQQFSITPIMEHYACMVDLLGRAGHLDEANDLINKMPFEPDSKVWGALLGACKIHCNVELGEWATKHLFKLEPENAGNYVLLANIYAAARKWDSVAEMRTILKDKRLKKKKGCSWIEIKNKIHAFHVGNRTHPQTEEIYAMLDTLAGQIEDEGYSPDMNLNITEEENEFIPCNHSEKLAIAFGIINTRSGTSIRITKNLRVCNSCHSAAKFISKIAQREIIIRDINRFHHFKSGSCSCGDYW